MNTPINARLRLALLLVALLPLAAPAQAPIKAVYHLTLGVAEASRAIANIRYHLAAAPGTRIVVVANGSGVDFLLEGARTPQNQPFAGAIGDLVNQGVEFRVCQNTLDALQIPADRVAMEASVVPSGVAEVARLQAREGFVYLRP